MRRPPPCRPVWLSAGSAVPPSGVRRNKTPGSGRPRQPAASASRAEGARSSRQDTCRRLAFQRPGRRGKTAQKAAGTAPRRSIARQRFGQHAPKAWPRLLAPKHIRCEPCHLLSSPFDRFFARLGLPRTSQLWALLWLWEKQHSRPLPPRSRPAMER